MKKTESNSIPDKGTLERKGRAASCRIVLDLINDFRRDGMYRGVLLDKSGKALHMTLTVGHPGAQ